VCAFKQKLFGGNDIMNKQKSPTEKTPTSHVDELNRLAKVAGQISGIEKMILDERYCPEIIQQLRAATSALKAIEVAILRRHIASCIKKSAESDSASGFERKLKELMELIRI
jgi:CsoR family transcriptional regulator, copper-sensing transcriptional repressor